MRSSTRRHGSPLQPALAALGIGLAALAHARPSRAEPPAPGLLARLAIHAASFEAMRTHAAYAVDGRLEHIDGDGKTDCLKEMKGRMDADGKAARFVLVSYVEDGKDKTEEARKKARDEKEESKEERDKREIHMPFLASEQGRYRFDQVGVDAADPARLRIAFVPVAPGQSTIEGSAWVDARTGTVISAGFKLSKTPMLVEYVHVTVEFGASTPLGPAISKVTFEGKGGFLFVRKRFRGGATASDYRIIP